jgi:YesN/AraC family two-component response regulator
MIKILTVDDDRFRRYVRKLLSSEADITVVGEAVNGKEAGVIYDRS